MGFDASTGIFGKLPAHGDFVMRDLPHSFVSAWDEWLQHFIAGTKEQLGEDWLNIYLTSPIWRFVFSRGVVDDTCWAGIMLPSVDKVGRYYPISVVRKLPENSNPLEFINVQSSWFSAIEENCLEALNDEMDVDDLSSRLNQLELNLESVYMQENTVQNGYALQINMAYEEQLPVSVYPYLFNSLLKNNFSSYGVWSTTGSEHVEPCLFISQSLPPISGLPAMMDGAWQQWGWQQPCRLTDFKVAEIIND